MKLRAIFDHSKPCPHMGRILSRTADGTASRWARWYALAHTAQCGPCRRLLESLQAMSDRLRGLSQPVDSDVIDRLAEGAWREAARDRKDSS